MFKRGPGVWRCSAPAVMCKSWFHSCNRRGKSRCSGDELLWAAGSCLYLPRALGKSLTLAILRHAVTASQGGITGCPALLGPQPTFRAVSDAKGCSFCFFSFRFFSFHHICEAYPVPYQQPCCWRGQVQSSRKQLQLCCSCLSLSSPRNVFAAK